MKTFTHTKKAIRNICTSAIFVALFLPVSLLVHEQGYAVDKMTEKELTAAITKLLHDKPEILFSVLKENSPQLIETITKASEYVRIENLKKQWKEDLKVTKSFELKNRPTLGKNTAKNTIVSYSDFLCSYCAQAAKTIQNLADKRDDVQIIFKSVPNNDAGRTASSWFYHINQKDTEKAWQFHDSLFANQRAFAADPIGVIKQIVTQQGFDANKMEKAIKANQKQLDSLIDMDIKEANDMKFTGTPYFVVNNVVLRGAHPIQTFEDAIKFTNENK